jgi:hypothetical protein
MFSHRTTWLRAAIILALALLVSSDAALASFLCPHMSGCQHAKPASHHSKAAIETHSASAMPCCPVNPQLSMDCDVGAMQCCTWHHRDADGIAVLFASDRPHPKQLAAVLPPAASVLPLLIARDHIPGLAADLAYVKPVPQKKTDLRI